MFLAKLTHRLRGRLAIDMFQPSAHQTCSAGDNLGHDILERIDQAQKQTGPGTRQITLTARTSLMLFVSRAVFGLIVGGCTRRVVLLAMRIKLQRHTFYKSALASSPAQHLLMVSRRGSFSIARGL